MRRLFPRLAEALFGDDHGGDRDPDAEPSGLQRDDGASQPGSTLQQQERRPAADSSCLRVGSIMNDAPACDGGLQGLSSQKLVVDEDGDEAHEFLVVDRRPLQSTSLQAPS
mmetsp:Transcript_22073/g.56366  ORF Transcript_22073/g.56366 Transcript_22073/m.56366 type:complete len:111 (+) Transcript_22073:81-413(+)